jgi:hypothetical protein
MQTKNNERVLQKGASIGDDENKATYLADVPLLCANQYVVRDFCVALLAPPPQGEWSQCAACFHLEPQGTCRFTIAVSMQIMLNKYFIDKIFNIKIG